MKSFLQPEQWTMAAASHWLLVTTVLLSVMACSSVPAPVAELAAAEQAILTAEQARVNTYAASELAQARQKLQDARAAVVQKDMLQASRLAQQSKLDAELALARAGAAEALAVNDEMKKSTEILQQEMLRNQTGVKP
ncbi:DUF4398 domain-containing protein [Rheinheimera riviphila]|uniref:DUF4398 domain-containing protein n=1 Tax=Rheinheimera riviphila TaxID=1834037 RepID=A0A437R111_9GAMM|nr:DUF4398 domain-containing protein [Rheinheimera riviphila]RVU40438.1 DUF4398 domain-containing protein [Rheinheimera riviphila]